MSRAFPSFCAGFRVAYVVAALGILSSFGVAPHAAAQDVYAGPQPNETSAVRYNEVELQAEVMREVENDQLMATMFAELQETNPAALQQALNRIGAQAHRIAESFLSKDLKVRTGRNQTYPVYDRNNQLTGWRGRTEVRIESRDFVAAGKLIGQLQQHMQVGNVSFSVSPELKRATEQELITEVVQAFRDRAALLTRALDGKAYRLRRLSVQTSGGMPPPRPMTMRAASADMEAMAPVLEGGTSQVNVGAVGMIEIL